MAKTMERPKIIVQGGFIRAAAGYAGMFCFPVSPRGTERKLLCPHL